MPLVENLDIFFRDWRHAAHHYPMRWDAVAPYLGAGGPEPIAFIGYLRRIPRLVGAGTNDRQVHDNEFKCKHADVIARGIVKDHGIMIGTWDDGVLLDGVLFRVRRTPEESSGLCTLSLEMARA